MERNFKPASEAYVLQEQRKSEVDYGLHNTDGCGEKNIITPEMEKVAAKEKMDVEVLRDLIAKGQVIIPANKIIRFWIQTALEVLFVPRSMSIWEPPVTGQTLTWRWKR